jgi:CheY-like chemotaxis protein
MSQSHNATHSQAEWKTVMICDDDRDSRELFGLALSPRYNVILVDSGESCVEKFIEEKNRGKKIHLILLDYGLSDMRGDSVARKIKEYNGTKIILITAYDIDDVLLKDLEEDGCITTSIKKPIHLRSLMELVAEIIS